MNLFFLALYSLMLEALNDWVVLLGIIVLLLTLGWLGLHLYNDSPYDTPPSRNPGKQR